MFSITRGFYQSKRHAGNLNLATKSKAVTNHRVIHISWALNVEEQSYETHTQLGNIKQPKVVNVHTCIKVHWLLNGEDLR